MVFGTERSPGGDEAHDSFGRTAIKQPASPDVTALDEQRKSVAGLSGRLLSRKRGCQPAMPKTTAFRPKESRATSAAALSLCAAWDSGGRDSAGTEAAGKRPRRS